MNDSTSVSDCVFSFDKDRLISVLARELSPTAPSMWRKESRTQLSGTHSSASYPWIHKLANTLRILWKFEKKITHEIYRCVLWFKIALKV